LPARMAFEKPVPLWRRRTIVKRRRIPEARLGRAYEVKRRIEETPETQMVEGGTSSWIVV
ncbi:MAG: hypothetical protein MUO24_04765, partial [Desulfobacterales bacterium]|nr:hypothetical protein [Desulfobacterales bacterium]